MKVRKFFPWGDDERGEIYECLNLNLLLCMYVSLSVESRELKLHENFCRRSSSGRRYIGRHLFDRVSRMSLGIGNWQEEESTYLEW